MYWTYISHPSKGTGLCGAVAVLLSGHELPPEVETSQMQGKMLLHLELVGKPLNHSSDWNVVYLNWTFLMCEHLIKKCYVRKAKMILCWCCFRPFLPVLVWFFAEWTKKVYLIIIVYIFLLHYSVWVLTFYLSDALLIEISPYNFVWKIQSGKISWFTENRE